jgi:hypothetical protein
MVSTRATDASGTARSATSRSTNTVATTIARITRAQTASIRRGPVRAINCAQQVIGGRRERDSHTVFKRCMTLALWMASRLVLAGGPSRITGTPSASRAENPLNRSIVSAPEFSGTSVARRGDVTSEQVGEHVWG